MVKKTVFQVNSGNFPEFFKIFQKDIIIMQSGPFYNIYVPIHDIPYSFIILNTIMHFIILNIY